MLNSEMTDDGDAQYLRETGVAHFLHAASLMAAVSTVPRLSQDFNAKSLEFSRLSVSSAPGETGAASRSSRAVFQQIVAPTGDLRMGRALFEDVLNNATKIHPALLLRFLRGVCDEETMAMPTSPTGLDYLGVGRQLTVLLEPAAELTAARGADVLQETLEIGDKASPLPLFGSAVIDLARSLRQMQNIVLRNLPEVPPPAQPTKDQPQAVVDPSAYRRAVQVHVDVVVELPLEVAEPPSEAVRVLEVLVAQLQWLLARTQLIVEGRGVPLEALDGAAPGDAAQPPQRYDFYQLAKPTFLVHASLGGAGSVSDSEYGMLLRAAKHLVAATPSLADVVTVVKPELVAALRSVTTTPMADETNARFVIVIGTDLRRFHVGQCGEALASAIADHASRMAVGGNTEAISPPPTKAPASLAPSKGPAKSKTAAGGDKTPAASGVGVPPPSEADSRTAFVYACVRRREHAALCCTKGQRYLDGLSAGWLGPMFRSNAQDQSPSKHAAPWQCESFAVPALVMPYHAITMASAIAADGTPRQADASPDAQAIVEAACNQLFSYQREATIVPTVGAPCVAAAFAYGLCRRLKGVVTKHYVTTGSLSDVPNLMSTAEAATSLAVAKWYARACAVDAYNAGARGGPASFAEKPPTTAEWTTANVSDALSLSGN
jgi:hypothetical protein